MPSVDNRVVRMEFDNAAFERKIQTTLASLKKLDQALKMQGAKKGLDDVNASGSKLNKSLKFDQATKSINDTTKATKDLNNSMKFEGAKKGLNDLKTTANHLDLAPTISRGIEGVSKSFIALGAVGVTAISSITTGALQAGLGAAQKGVAAVVGGFQEYETNLNSIQTILANTESKGTTLPQVNAALQQLNEYSDKTIYNFSQMAKNIGTFTAAGLDLDTSVNSIKGIAQLAAVSGSNAEQASTAMYQLSQALSQGKLALQDWNSVNAAGMGGEIFKTRLLETAQALGTINTFPLGTTFKGWEKANGSFRDSLKDGAINADVLSTALSTFTGDLSNAELAAKGFGKETIAAIQKSAKTATGAAQDVKTFTQLIGTLKEAVGTGFADTFRLIIGNFGEAKELFTNINNVLGGIVGKFSDARNSVLTTWNKLGGRKDLFAGLAAGGVSLLAVFKSIKDAFREVFPRKTGVQLADLSRSFAKFMHALMPSKETLETLKRIFTGLFSVLKIGTTIISQVGKVFFRIIKAVGGGLGPGFFDILANIADVFTNLQKALVGGGAIEAFFTGIGDVIVGAIEQITPFVQVIQEIAAELFGGLADAFGGILPFVDKIKSFFADIFGGASDKAGAGVTTGVEKVQSGLEKLEPITSRIQKRFEMLKEVFASIGNFFAEVGRVIGDVASSIWDAIVSAFGGVGGGNYDKIIDALNVGLLGGLLLLFRKFIKDGIKLDFTGGIFSSLGDRIDQLKKPIAQLGKTLQAFQLKMKAEAIMKIAKAMLVLVASLVILSLIDSAALTKAVIAMAAVTGGLVGVLAALNKLDLSGDTMKQFLLLAAGMAIIGVSMIFLAKSAKILGSMSWDEILFGLGAMGAILFGLVKAVEHLKESEADLVKTSLSLIILGFAISQISRSVKTFAKMDWDAMKQGLIGFGISLGIVVTAINAMPEKMEKKTKGLTGFGVAINLIVFAMKQIAGMSIVEIAKGLGTLGLALYGFTKVIDKFPKSMEKRTAGLIGLAIAINLMAVAMRVMGGMDLKEIGIALLAMAAATLILAIAANAMTSAVAGAGAMLIMSAAILVLSVALKALTQLSWGDLVMSLLKIGLALAAFAAAAALLVGSGAIFAMAALAGVLALLGVGFALVGVGAYAVAKAFEVFGRVGPKAFENFKKGIKAVAAILPDLFRGFAEGILEVVKMVLDLAPKLIPALAKLFTSLLDAVILVIPKLQEVLGALIVAGMATIRTFGAQYIKTGFFLLTKLLEGISSNIGRIVNLVVDIIMKFTNAMAERMPDIVGMGLTLIMALIRGVLNNIVRIGRMVVTIITTLVTEIGKGAGRILAAGTALIVNFLTGIANSVTLIIAAGTSIITNLITGIGNAATEIATAAGTALTNFLTALADPTRVQDIVDAGVDILESLLKGIVSGTDQIAQAVIDFINAMATVIENKSKPLSDAFYHLGTALIDGLIEGIGTGVKLAEYIVKKLAESLPGPLKEILGIKSPSTAFFDLGINVAEGLADGISSGAGAAVDAVSGLFDRDSPSKVAMAVGKDLVAGLAIGIDNNADMATKSAANMAKTIVSMVQEMSDVEEFNPVITPVLDLTKVAADASLINGLIPNSTLAGSLSFAQANEIARTPTGSQESGSENSPGGDSAIKFEQNIYAPEKLSMADIYKQTRNQITMAKEELKIP